MRFVDGVILVVGLLGVIIWATYSSKDGFKGSDAMIVARSVSVAATLGGQVENELPAVGSKLAANDLLVRIHNGRVDRTRLVEFESQREYLESELDSARAAQKELGALVEKFEQRADAYRTWIEQDVRLRKTVTLRRLDVAQQRSRMKTQELDRLERLLDQQHASKVVAAEAKMDALIAQSEAALVGAELLRSDLLLRTVKAEGISADDGDTSYWEKTADALRLRHFDTRGRIALLKAELVRTTKQITAESARITTHFSEEHLAPFSGVVNATFVTQGARVAPGTNLLQVLDCARPIVIIPIPEHRMGQFAVGMKATVHPVDSDESMAGIVTHISSGPLLGHDQSVQLSEALTASGNRAIVSLDDGLASSLAASCDTARKAIAVIHSRSLFDRVSSWVSAHLPESAVSLLGLTTAAAQPPSGTPLLRPEG